MSINSLKRVNTYLLYIIQYHVLKIKNANIILNLMLTIKYVFNKTSIPAY